MARRAIAGGAAAAALLALAACGDDGGGDAARDGPRFSAPTKINNPYLPLALYRRCVLEGEEDGARVRVVRRLLERTQPFTFAGQRVQTIVIEDMAYEDGELVERTLDYFGQSDDGTVYYFGEDVNDYKDGKLIGHGGSWRVGRDTEKLGVAMPPRPVVGMRWRFEDVPGVTIENNLVVDEIPRQRVGGRSYRDLIRVRELLHPDAKREFKLYARGYGVVSEIPPEGRVDLVGCER